MASVGNSVFSCVGSGGVKNSFRYKFEVQGIAETTWRFLVISEGVNGFFELALKELDDFTVRVVFIGNHGVPELSGKGIAGSLLQVARREIKRIIESSPRNGETGDVYRTDDAEKVWSRLVSSGIALHDNSRDVYTLP